MPATSDPDFADIAVAQWRRERPDLDFSAMAPLARFGRLGVIGGRVVDAEFAAHDIDRGEFDVLASLRRGGAPFELTPSRLADVLLVSRAGMTKRVDRLARRGLVERRPQAHDRRSHLIALTDKGRTLVDEVVAQHTVNESRLLAALAPDEVAAFDAVLRKLLSVLSDTDVRAGGESEPQPANDGRRAASAGASRSIASGP